MEKIFLQVANAQDASSLSLGFITDVSNWQDLVTKITGWVLILGAVIAFFYLIYSGFVYITAGGNAEAAQKGQKGIINAVIGIVIIALAYAIVSAVIGFTGGRGSTPPRNNNPSVNI